MKTNKTVLLTGGGGFIGSNIIRRLLQEEYEIVVFSLENIEDSKINDLKDKIKFFQLDLSQAEKTNEILHQINPSIIIHLAASLDRRRKPELIKKLLENNLQTTLNIYLASIRLNELKSIITFGSAEEYGQNQVPFNENQKEFPVSPYSFSKTCVNHLSHYFSNIHSLPITIIRPFVVYGEYQTNNQLIPYLIKKCLNNETVDMTQGEQTRDFVHIQDLTEAVVQILKNPLKTKGEIINICSGQAKRIKEVALLIKEMTNSSSIINFGALDYQEGENMNFYGSNLKAQRLLNWAPKISLEQGIKRTIEWFRSKKTNS